MLSQGQFERSLRGREAGGGPAVALHTVREQLVVSVSPAGRLDESLVCGGSGRQTAAGRSGNITRHGITTLLISDRRLLAEPSSEHYHITTQHRYSE